MSYEADKAIEYVRSLQDQIDGLKHLLALKNGELAISNAVRYTLRQRVDELELRLSRHEPV